MADVNDLIEDTPKHLSRRNVIVGTAWAVPVVMGVGATPAFATSAIVGNPTAEVTVKNSKLTFKITVSGYKSGDTVSVSISPDGLEWNKKDNPIGSHDLTGTTTTITGNLTTKKPKTPVAYTVTFVVTSGSKTFTKVAFFTW